jgi:hypothetical protein
VHKGAGGCVRRCGMQCRTTGPTPVHGLSLHSTRGSPDQRARRVPAYRVTVPAINNVLMRAAAAATAYELT